jgi:signal peptidase I
MVAGGLSANALVTGSMEPKVPVGSLLVYEKVAPESLRRGDVVSFVKPNGDGTVTTHRIVDIGSRDGTPVFRTKGDNNPVVDPWLIRYEAGQEPRRLAHVVPYVGHAVTAAQRPLVRASLLVLVLGWLYVAFLRALARGRIRPRADARLAVPPRVAAPAAEHLSDAGRAAPRLEAPPPSPTISGPAASRRRDRVRPARRRRPPAVPTRGAAARARAGVTAGPRD